MGRRIFITNKIDEYVIIISSVGHARMQINDLLTIELVAHLHK